MDREKMEETEKNSCKRPFISSSLDNDPLKEISKKQKVEKEDKKETERVADLNVTLESSGASEITTAEGSVSSSNENAAEDITLAKEKKEDGKSVEAVHIEQALNDDKRECISKEEQDKTVKKTEPTELSKPKFVFGASSSFSSGFGVASKPFGSSSIFSNGFNVVSKESPAKEHDAAEEPLESNSSTTKSITQEGDTNDGSEEEHDESSASSATQSEPLLKLTKQDVKSGEELENSIYQTNAKLYQLSSIKEGWKERGVGVLRVNKDEHSGKSRVIMRSRGLLKVILNLPLVKSFSIKKGFPGSLASDKFVRIIAVDSENHPVQYALRVGKSDTADELYDNIIKLIPEE